MFGIKKNTPKRLAGIRGAVCAENTRESILRATEKMCAALFSENALSADDIVSVHFTVTRDLDEMNPCAALRRADCGVDVSGCALFCSQEAYVKGGLPGVIRVLVTAYADASAKPHPVYLDGAECLRPDLCGK